MFVQIVTIEIRQGERAHFLDAMRMNCIASRREAGVVRFDVLGDPEDAHRFEIYEVFQDRQALEAHRASAHYRACRDIIAPLTVAGSKRYPEAVMVEERAGERPG